MYLLIRKSKGLDIINYLAVFDSEKAVKKYKHDCMACHESGKYEYEILTVPYLELKEEYK